MRRFKKSQKAMLDQIDTYRGISITKFGKGYTVAIYGEEVYTDTYAEALDMADQYLAECGEL